MKLPCRHIFAIRKHNGQDLFCPSLIGDRWTVAYYKGHRFLSAVRPRLSISVNPVAHRPSVSENKKWKKAGEVFAVVQTVLSRCGIDQFEEHLSCVKKHLSLWQEDKEAFVGEFIQQAPEVEVIPTETEATSTENDVSHAAFYPETKAIGTENDATRAAFHPGTEATSTENDENVDVLNQGTECNKSVESNVLYDLFVPDTPLDNEGSQSLLGATFAPMLKKCGRSKGSCTTAIGLPKKKRLKKLGDIMPFHRKSTLIRQKYVLSFL